MMIYWEITTSLSQYPKQNIPRFPVQEISYLKKMRRKYLIMKFRYRTEQERATKKKFQFLVVTTRAHKIPFVFNIHRI